MLVQYTLDTTVAEWVDRWYKPERLADPQEWRNDSPNRRERIIADREADIARYGETLISHHEAVTGANVWLLDRDERRPYAPVE